MPRRVPQYFTEAQIKACADQAAEKVRLGLANLLRERALYAGDTARITYDLKLCQEGQADQVILTTGEITTLDESRKIP